MENKVIKAYKGFDKNLKCRGFQYEVGKTYETDDVKVCGKGFHACERPIDVFNYYRPAESRYCEVELSGEIAAKEDKTASTKIKIIKEISINDLITAQIEYNKTHCTEENTDPKVASAGNCGAASAGECGAASAGECGAASAGYKGAASAGECGAASSRGSAEVGDNGVAVARNETCKARGGKGAVIVLVRENDTDYNIRCWKAFEIDGELCKENVWYTLNDEGEVVEINE